MPGWLPSRSTCTSGYLRNRYNKSFAQNGMAIMKIYPKRVYDLIEFLDMTKQNPYGFTQLIKMPREYKDEWAIAYNEGLVAEEILSDKALKMIGEPIPTNKLPPELEELDKTRQCYLRITEEGAVALSWHRLQKAEVESGEQPAKPEVATPSLRANAIEALLGDDSKEILRIVRSKKMPKRRCELSVARKSSRSKDTVGDSMARAWPSAPTAYDSSPAVMML
jgi:hypothetical protein